MLLAVHLSDGVLTWPWWVGGWVAACLWVGIACWRISDREIPRIGVLTAAFFVGSQIHLPLGGVSVHLLLNGLVGVVIGRRAGVIIAIGLLLQALLFGHGGLTTLGINIAVYTVPAVLAGWSCGPLRQAPVIRHGPVRFALVFALMVVWLATATLAAQWVWVRARTGSGGDFAHWATWWVAEPEVGLGLLALAALAAGMERWLEADPEFAVGLLLGAGTGFATVMLNALVLAVGGMAEVKAVAGVAFLANLPVILVESVVSGFVVRFLSRAKPEWIGGPTDQGRSVSGWTSSKGTSH